MSPKFSTSTGSNFWKFSGIFEESYYQYWFLLVLRLDESAPVVAKKPASQKRPLFVMTPFPFPTEALPLATPWLGSGLQMTPGLMP